jgi:NADPH-dependent F420 reductase
MESTKPIIAIIGGTGKEGPGLAMRWAKAGYRVIIGSRQAEKAQNTAQTINQQLGLNNVIGMENAAAAREADICVLTVIQSAHQEAILSIRAALQEKSSSNPPILVDATARVDFRNPVPPPPPAAARQAQEWLGEKVQVVAAFQTAPASALRDLENPIHSDVLVCSDHLEAAEKVMRLAQDGGMNAYYAGGLDNAVVVEGLTALLISLNKYYRVKTASVRISGVPTQQSDR